MHVKYKSSLKSKKLIENCVYDTSKILFELILFSKHTHNISNDLHILKKLKNYSSTHEKLASPYVTNFANLFSPVTMSSSLFFCLNSNKPKII